MTSTLITGRDSCRSDLDSAIAHVVGQGVVALSAGCEIHLAINPHPGGEFYEGNCWVRHPSGELPGRLKQAIGVAGGIAELALERGTPGELDAAEVFDRLQSSSRITEDFTLADVAHSLNVLCSRWALVIDEVARMAPQITNNTHLTH